MPVAASGWRPCRPKSEAGHMVAGIREERVAGYAGDVRALAQKLIEEFP